MPFVADLEACQRVAAAGLNLFRQMTSGYTTEVSRTLQGKIASVSSKNYRFAGRLKQVQAELDRQPRFLDLSKENRALKEEVEKLQGLQKKLDETNSKVSEQAKKMEELPTAKEERDWARQAEKELREESACLRQQVELLAKGKDEAEKRAATASPGGFQHAINVTATLVPWINWAFFDGKHYDKDKKIWLGDEMVHDPALHREAEEDEEEEEKADDQGADGGDPNENARGPVTFCSCLTYGGLGMG